MTYDFSQFKKKLGEIEEWFRKELAVVRAGRASPALVDNIYIDYYGAKTPLKHLATISVEDARTLRIRPWESSLIPQIEAGIRLFGGGLMPAAEKDSLRVVFPELTQERRESLLKIISKKKEEARISARQLRDECWKDIQRRQQEGKISEDDKFRLKDELQKLIDDIGDKLEKMADNKEKEIQQ
jgi:ribosome recycling factor